MQVRITHITSLFTRYAIAFLTFITCITFAVSCNKSEPLTTPADILAGKWRIVQTATDDNNNKVLDAAELRDMDPKDVVTLAFHYGGQGIEEQNYYGVVTDYYY